VQFNLLNYEFVAGLIGLVPAHLPWSHSLQYADAHAWTVVVALSVGAFFENYYFAR